MGLIDDLTLVADDILGIRDSIGAAIHNVYIVTRTWSGSEPGDGTPTDVVAQMLPTPALVDLSHKFVLQEPGRYKQGDIMLKGISKQSYGTEDIVRLKSASKAVEKFYRINSQLYVVVNVRESYITWDVHVRRVTQ